MPVTLATFFKCLLPLWSCCYSGSSGRPVVVLPASSSSVCGGYAEHAHWRREATIDVGYLSLFPRGRLHETGNSLHWPCVDLSSERGCAVCRGATSGQEMHPCRRWSRKTPVPVSSCQDRVVSQGALPMFRSRLASRTAGEAWLVLVDVPRPPSRTCPGALLRMQ